MPRVEAWELVKEFLFPGRSGVRAIPPLDGGLTPNDALERIDDSIDELPGPDDMVRDAFGSLYVTTADKVVRRYGLNFGHHEVTATVPGEAGAIALDHQDGLLVCVAGLGLVRIDQGGGLEVLVDADSDGVPTHCLTGVAVAGDGTLYLTDGSLRHHGGDWVRDLMEQNALGRLLRYDPRTRRTTVLASGLAHPSGLTLTPDEDALIVSEAWSHSLRRFPLSNPGRAEVFRDNLPGYPGRISRASGGGYWLAVFALRTQLVEFVLSQRDYVEEMMRTIEPDLWIRPALRGLDSGLEPLQGGQIRKLGVIKPWAPPRSYGLVTRLDPDGYPVRSLHSRGGGRRHGVTSVKQYGDRLFIAVRGGDEVLITRAGDPR